MTDRKPDFYRVVRVRNGVKEWLRWLKCTGPLGFTRHKHDAAGFLEKSSSGDTALDMAERHGGKLVPVYVKVTRKPKLHDFAWALKRMREGKRVRRVCDSWRMASIGIDVSGNLRWEDERLASLTNENVLATDWELAP